MFDKYLKLQEYDKAANCNKTYHEICETDSSTALYKWMNLCDLVKPERFCLTWVWP